jgi:hypothetical protein
MLVLVLNGGRSSIACWLLEVRVWATSAVARGRAQSVEGEIMMASLHNQVRADILALHTQLQTHLTLEEI